MPRTIWLDVLEVARGFPLQTPMESEGRRRCDMHGCGECGGPLDEVLITTAGTPIWEAYPLAVDGWWCPACSQLSLPRFLEPEEVDGLTRQAVQAAAEGRLAEAEQSFRRVANSWPGYAPGRVNLARLYERMLRTEERPEQVERILDEMQRQLCDALTCEVTSARPRAVAMLTAVLLRRERVQEALALVDRHLELPEVSPEERAGLTQLRGWVVGRGDLYERGV
ncbi:MAG: hypothetical protein AB1758_04350, partial [Candidatus Eremiobacterota bacterium]